jgi:hypothetical protein
VEESITHLALDVHAGLVRERMTRGDDIRGSTHEIRFFVNLEPDPCASEFNNDTRQSGCRARTVAEAMRKVLAVPSVGDDLARRGVDRARDGAVGGGLGRGGLGLLDGVPDQELLVRNLRLVQRERPRNVALVPVQGAAAVDEDKVLRAERPVGPAAVRERRVFCERCETTRSG